jgi:hypothetical protein
MKAFEMDGKCLWKEQSNVRQECNINQITAKSNDSEEKRRAMNESRNASDKRDNSGFFSFSSALERENSTRVWEKSGRKMTGLLKNNLIF